MKTNQNFRILFIILAGVISGNIIAQITWNLEQPKAPQNGTYFIESPENSNQFFFFGHTTEQFDPDATFFETKSSAPSDVLFRSATNTYSAPEPHLGFHLINDQTWLMASRDIIYRTEDAGQSWVEVLQLFPNTQYLNSAYFTDIHFPTDQVGYAVGTADKIFKTSDGGLTWTELQWSNSTAPYRRLNSVKFIDEQRGFALGYEVDDILLNIGSYNPLIYYTEDGGQSWETTLLPLSDHHYLEIDFANDSTYYLSVVNRNFVLPLDQLYKSTDRGRTWNMISLPGTTANSSLVIRDMHWFSANEGILLGSPEIAVSQTYAYRTTDGGTNWTEITLSEGERQFFLKVPNLRITFSGNIGVIGGTTGNVLLSTDKGESWESVREGLPDIYGVSLQENTAWAVGFGNYVLQNNGAGWNTIKGPGTYGSASSYVDVDHQNQQVGITDVYGSLYISEDQGQTWSTLFPGTDTLVRSVQFTEDKLSAFMYLPSTDQYLLYEAPSNSTPTINLVGTDANPSGNDAMYTIGNDVRFIRTLTKVFYKNDQTWEDYTTFPNDAVPQSFTITPDGVGLVQTISGQIYQTDDAAQTWNPLILDPSITNQLNTKYSLIREIKRIDSNTLIAIILGTSEINNRFFTYIIVSNDNGTSWELSDLPFDIEPLELGTRAVDVYENEVLIGSSNGSLFSGELLTTSIKRPIQKAEFLIYPNPVIDRIQIASTINFSDAEIYSIDGRLVYSTPAMTDNQIHLPEKLTSGVYIIRLQDKEGRNVQGKFVKR